MATISKRGSSWRAQVKYRGQRFTASFSTEEAARTWAKAKEHDLRSSVNQLSLIELTPGELRRMYKRSVDRSKEHGTPHTLTYDEFLELWSNSNKRCALSGLPFTSVKIEGNRRRPFFPSLDRIDPSKGYEPGNVRLVCVLANIARADYSDGLLFTLVRGLVLTNPDRFSLEVLDQIRIKAVETVAA